MTSHLVAPKLIAAAVLEAAVFAPVTLPPSLTVGVADAVMIMEASEVIEPVAVPVPVPVRGLALVLGDESKAFDDGRGVSMAVERSVVVLSFERVATVSRTPPIGPVGGAVELVTFAAREAYVDCEVELSLSFPETSQLPH